MRDQELLLLSQLSCCVAMSGVIWTIQILHYPAFAFVPENQFAKFHAFHSRKIAFVVVPLMFLELITAAALVFLFAQHLWSWMNACGVVLIWLSTFLISVPLHNKLALRKDASVIDQLIRTNWVRTALWTSRLALLIWVILSLPLRIY